jgi:hypothetical protein
MSILLSFVFPVCESTAAQLSFHFQNSGNSLLGLISFFFSLQYLVATGGPFYFGAQQFNNSKANRSNNWSHRFN